MGSLEGRSFIVTGGGTGIGAACAARLVDDGATVTICGRTEQRLIDAAASLSGRPGVVHHVVADVTVEDDVARLVDSAVDVAGGRLDGVVANAGGGGAIAPF